jgi:hypothetical protein
MTMLALVPLARAKRAGGPADSDRIPDRAIVARASRELSEVQTRVSREGWDDEAIARALSAARLIAAAAVDQTISQKPVDTNGGAPDGRLVVRHGVIRPKARSVSSSTTADDIQRARNGGPQRFSTTRQQQLEGLQAGLATLTAALYRKEPSRDRLALDEAARQALSLARELQSERSAVKTWVRR